ncbi:snRNA-activating protein complex subunit 3 [Lampris incognitus]|uniref:snRNA-activating protein complex subunit 3 n=1 Tax=Lampris incognitus TaxID=2546036 RepID=UPI0024B50E1F|nr:snRNA-activating protein complex subunit 3 [Lampris incognitus]
MATCSSFSTGGSNIPEYEYIEVNTKPFHIGSFRNAWLERLRPSDYSYQEEDAFDADFAEKSGITAETMSEIKTTCSIDSLRCHSADQLPTTEVVPPDPVLKTLKQRQKGQDCKDSQKISRLCRHDYADELARLVVGKTAEEESNVVPEGEVIISVNIYYPTVFERFKYIRPHMTLMVTGSQSLADLRDSICCISDLQISGEFSHTPDLAPDFISKDHYKSAFFFFEGVFYNDMRFPECQDISETTVEWAKGRNHPPFRKAKMEDTQFVDLTVKVGFPYLYCHQGDCEHLVIITDVRLSHKNDCLDRTLYPLLIHKHRVSTRKCSVCHVYIGRWMTVNDQFAPSDPCLFCDKCFRMLHYDTQGNKLGDFMAYAYVDPGAFN